MDLAQAFLARAMDKAKEDIYADIMTPCKLTKLARAKRQAYYKHRKAYLASLKR